MTCRRAESLLSAYIDGELTGYEMLAVREHLSFCAPCKAEHQSLLAIKRLLSSIPGKEPREEFIHALESLPSRSALDLVLTRMLRDWQQSIVERSAAGKTGVANRRLAYTCVLSLVGAWLLVAPAARTPQADQPSKPQAPSSRLLNFVRFPSPIQLLHLRSMPVNVPAYETAHFGYTQPDFGQSQTRAAHGGRLDFLSSSQSMPTDMPPAPPTPRAAYANAVFTGYSVASR